MSFFSFYASRPPRVLHSFPTRRSSDLLLEALDQLLLALERMRRHHGLDAVEQLGADGLDVLGRQDRKSTRLNSSHLGISYAVFCLKKKKKKQTYNHTSRISIYSIQLDT